MSISVQPNTARILPLSNANGPSNAQDSSAAGDADGATQGGAGFGAISVERQLNAHRDLVSILNDTLQTGVGPLVDTDLETESAKLQALQIQQQLGGQPFSIANQAPQVILQLFRS